jgi:homoserine dehydrogenase
MTTVLNDVEVQTTSDRARPPRDIRVALLGLGQIGGAIAAMAQTHTDPACRFSIASALVRDVHRRRALDTSAIALTADPSGAFAASPDIVVEVLGGLEPARSLVLAALAARLPVVTANKSLLAVHGDELFAAANAAGVPLFYEASVLAGVPFLGTFSRRPLARRVTGVQGIVNGTSNFVLSRMARDGVDFSTALKSAQRAGYAEPDPAKDIDGDDAAEKLCVLARLFGDWSVVPSAIERRSIRDLRVEDLHHAAAFGGAIRPVVFASWNGAAVTAYAGPAFVEDANPLSRVDGVQNAVALTTPSADGLFFSGPGAGPAVTAATVLDDVIEAASRPDAGRVWRQPRPCVVSGPSEAAWFVRLTSASLGEQQAPTLLTTLGIRLRRASHIDARSGRHHQWLLTQPCSRAHIAAALDVLRARSGCETWWVAGVE